MDKTCERGDKEDERLSPERAQSACRVKISSRPTAMRINRNNIFDSIRNVRKDGKEVIIEIDVKL